jgi:hypothetical protein
LLHDLIFDGRVKESERPKVFAPDDQRTTVIVLKRANK